MLLAAACRFCLQQWCIGTALLIPDVRLCFPAPLFVVHGCTSDTPLGRTPCTRLQIAGEVREMVLNERTAEMRALIEAFGEQPKPEASVAWLGDSPSACGRHAFCAPLRMLHGACACG